MSTISAGTTVGTALVNTGDTTGNLVLQTNGTTTAVTIGTNQVVTLAQALPIGSGGTGATTRQNAIDNLAGAVTNGLYLRGDGIDVVMGTLRAADMTGTLPVANGGTGQTTLTANHVLLGNGTSGIQAVDPGSSGNVLTSNGTTWTSASIPSSAPTTAQVLSATAGATAGAVGTYCIAYTTSATNLNATRAGSDLRGFSLGDSGFNPSFSGTWRNMGATQPNQAATLSQFLRIS